MKVTKRECVHTYLNRDNSGNEILILKERVTLDDGSKISNLRIIINPVVKFYITKPQYRTNVYKREVEQMYKLDEYTCAHKDIIDTIKKEFKIFGKVNPRNLLSNPYVYGADIDVEGYYRILYNLANKAIFNEPKCGYYDIENDMAWGTHQINCCSVTINNVVHSFINKHFSFKIVPTNIHGVMTEVRKELTIEDYEKQLDIMRGDDFRKKDIKVIFHMCTDERDLLIQLFTLFHTSDLDFVCIWNLAYDIPETIAAAQRNNINLAQLFSEPKLPNNLKYAEYIPDKRKPDHYTKVWHWMQAPASFQFIDSMALYSWNRCTQPREESYSLDYMLKKTIKDGKQFVIDDHAEFQKYRFDEYVIYNIIDTANFKQMDDVNKDVVTMCTMSQRVSVRESTSSYIKTRNAYYEDNKYSKNSIIASSGGNISYPGDEYLIAVGGAVLPPSNAFATGLRIIKEFPFFRTLLSGYVLDADFSSMYPTATIVLNMSNTTQLFTMLGIYNTIEQMKSLPIGAMQFTPIEYTSDIICAKEQIVPLCNKYYNLPSYSDMDNLITEKMKVE